MNAPNKFSFRVIGLFVAGSFVAPVVVLFAAMLGWLPADAVSVPPLWESRLGQAVIKASLSHQAAGLSNPLLGSDAELRAGMETFKNNCSGCHGDAAASHWGNNNFYPRVPQFGQSPPILSTAEMFVAIKHGIRYSGMFANEKLKEEKIWQIATFLSRLNSLPPDIEQAWKQKP
jgi:mono/diheme cytochrome c family protein